jgi:hypothetical protein
MKPITWVLIGGLVIVGLCLFAVFGGGIGRLLGGGGSPQIGSNQSGDLGRMYVAAEVDRQGCPVQTTTQFYADESVFVGVEESDIPGGTEMFVRLLHEGRPVEDTNPVQANRDMQGCVWFEFQPAGTSGFEPGDYEAELYVNGNAVDAVSFEVADAFAGGGGDLPNTGLEGVELGQVYTTSEVDQNGCPLDDLEIFYPDQPVYVSIDESFIPESTEVFTRLVYEGQAIEDTQPIVADRDMETCVWFEFEAGRSSSGLQPGDYTAEVYVNGELAETIDFAVE